MEKIKKNKIFLFFFLFLIVLSLILPYVCNAQDTNLPEANLITDNSSVETIFYANSELPIWGLYTMGKLPLKYPDRCKIYIKNPIGDTVYMSDAPSDKITETDDAYIVVVKDRGLKIPAFASSGSWTVELIFYSKFAGDLENVLAKGVYTLNVGESGILDHIFAPIYFYWDVGGWLFVGDELAIALPGVIYLSAIIWVPLLLIILVKYIRGSLSIGKKIYKKTKTEMKKT